MTERTGTRNRRKERVGTVVSDKMTRTVVVSLERRVTDPLYGKQTARTKRIVAHNDELGSKVGDLVRVVETRPLSRTKRWRVVEILERAK